MNTNFRKQLEAVEVPIPSSAQGLFNAPQTIGTFLGSDLVDAIVKLHEAEVKRIIGEDKTYQTATTDELKQGWHIYTVENSLRRKQRQRAAIEPKKEGK